MSSLKYKEKKPEVEGVRSLKVSDAEEVFELLRKVYESQPKEWPMGGGWTRSILLQELKRSCAAGYFDASGHLRGFILFRKLPDQVKEIILLATHPKFRGRGIMQALLKDLQAERPSGAVIWLEVHENNIPASKLYKKMGFVKTGMRAGYYRDGGNAVMYSLGPVQ